MAWDGMGQDRMVWDEIGQDGVELEVGVYTKEKITVMELKT